MIVTKNMLEVPKPKKKSAKEVTANKAAAKAAPASPGKPASKRKRQAR